MATNLSPLTPNSSGADAYTLLNALTAAVTQLRVDLSALTTTETQDVANIGQNLNSESTLRGQGDDANAQALTSETRTRAAAIATLGNTVAGKANASDLQQTIVNLAANIGLKADRGALDTLSGALAGLSNTVAGKANESDLQQTIVNLAANIDLKADRNALATLSGALSGLGNIVAGKANQSDLQTTITNIGQNLDTRALQQDFKAYQQLVTSQLSQYATLAVIQALQTSLGLSATAADLTSLLALVTGGAATRPGDSPGFFASVVAGGLAPMLSAIPAAWLVAGPDGRVVRVQNPAVISWRPFEPLVSGRAYRDSFAVRRTGNPIDPAGDAVDFRVAFFDANLNLLGTAAYRSVVNLTTASGLLTASFSVSAPGGAGAVVAPPGAVYRKPYVQVYGDGHVTDVSMVRPADVTDATNFSPDVSALQAQVTGLASANLPSRVTDLEQNATAPTTQAFPNRSSAAAAAVPGTVTLLCLAGYAAAGDGGALELRRLGAGEAALAPWALTTADGSVWQPLTGAGPLNILQVGAKGDGATDNLSIFTSVTAAAGRVFVPAGAYRMSADLVDETRLFDFAKGVTFTGAGRLFADVSRSFLRNASRPTIADVIFKMRIGAAVTIGCFGDSLTWGFQGDGNGDVNAQSNGYTTPPRSSITYPQAFQNGLRAIYAGNAAGAANIYAVNYGYPGDTSQVALKRWYDFGFCDAAVIMLGTNDGNITEPTGTFKNFLRQFIEKRLEVNCPVALMLPPTATQLDFEGRVHVIRAIVQALADEYGLPVIDARDQLAPLGYSAYQTFNLHMSTPGYALLGWDLAAMFAPDGHKAPRLLYPGGRITADDFPGDSLTQTSHFQTPNFPYSDSGYLVEVDPGYTFTIPVYVTEDCAPRLLTSQWDTKAGRDFTYSRIGLDVLTAAFPGPTGDGTVYRRGFPLPVLRRGWRLLQFRASGANAGLFDALHGLDPRQDSIVGADVFRKSPLAGRYRPPAGSGSGFWAARETRSVPFLSRVSAKLTLGGTAIAGLAVFVGPDFSETGSAAQIGLLRAGTQLILTAAGQPNVNIANAFPAGLWTGSLGFQITCSYSQTGPDPSSATVTAFVDGQVVGNRGNLPATGGYLGLLAISQDVLECAYCEVQEGQAADVAFLPNV